MMDSRRRLMMGSKLIGFATDFTTKEADWIEEGGTFTYNPSTATYPGLYSPEGAKAIGTLGNNYKYKLLNIPLPEKLSTWHAEAEYYIFSSSGDRVGHINVTLLDENDTVLAELQTADNQSGSSSSSIALTAVAVSTAGNHTFFTDKTGLQSAALHASFDYDGTTLRIGFASGTGSYTYFTADVELPPIAKAQIRMGSYRATTYTNGLNVRWLTVTPN